MTKNVSVPLVCALASMAGNKHPIPIVIVDRLRIVFNICYSLEGREFVRKKAPDAVCEGNAHGMADLCAAIGEAKRGKVTGSCMNAESVSRLWLCSTSMLERTADPIKNYLH
jgi:hypothetical protein